MRKLSIVLIVLGLSIICIPVLGKLYIYHSQQEMLKKYMEELGEYSTSEAITTSTAVDSQEDSIKESALPDAIGKIELPSISSNQPLLEGSNSEQLKYGAGHITGTAMPGQIGNCCIAGHRNYTFGTYFNRIDELKNGDTIEIFYNNTIYNYKVCESFVVSPDDISVLKNTDNKSIVTLITCHPKGSNTQRLIVRGLLTMSTN